MDVFLIEDEKLFKKYSDIKPAIVWKKNLIAKSFTIKKIWKPK